jgi:predicted nucleic acid-binding protein
MRLLLDANIFLEILLTQEKSEQAKELLAQIEAHDFFITDYALHSIGLTLFQRQRHAAFDTFVNDMIINVGVEVLSLSPDQMLAVTAVAQKFNLDFDDAYQYAVAEKHGLTLVSFDRDFDHTERGRKTPAEIS